MHRQSNRDLALALMELGRANTGLPDGQGSQALFDEAQALLEHNASTLIMMNRVRHWSVGH